MKLYLADTQTKMTDAWKREFQGYSNVVVHEGSIFDLVSQKCECFVSPANSWGYMNGGIDLRYSEFFGWDLQRRLQLLLAKYHGELLVGQAEIIETNHSDIKYLICAPTMRIPELLVDSVNAYLATRAALRIATDNGRLSPRPPSVAFPGMGTGVGRMLPDVCAKQMRAAYDEVILGQKPHITSLAGQVQYHYALASGSDERPN